MFISMLHSRFLLRTAYVLLLAIGASPAFAALGDNAGSVLADQARMKGTLRTVAGQSYVVHEITSAKGAVVREYVAPSGTVFGVVWEGQFPPDLRQVLGPYYQQAQEAVEQHRQQEQHQVRGHLLVQTPGLVYEAYGHQRSLHGRCFLPQMLPSGTAARDIR
jgi:hypothetical protein